MNKFIVVGISMLLCSVVSAADEATSKRDNIAEILSLLQQHLYNAQTLNWSDIEREAYATLGSTPTEESERKAIKSILIATKTNHTFYRYSDSKKVIFHSELSCRYEQSDEPDINADVGYLVIDRFSSGSRADAEDYIAQIAEQLMALDSQELKGWVIDLRRNSGGNMWPMLAALSPLFGNKRLGYFISPDGSKIQWGTYNNFSVLDNRYQYRFPSQYSVRNANIPIAVLVSSKTASSGEAVLIATRAFENVRTFGEASCGQSTSNKRYKLSNGDSLLVTGAVMADFKGEVFGQRIDVDEPTENALEAAQAWIDTLANSNAR